MEQRSKRSMQEECIEAKRRWCIAYFDICEQELERTGKDNMSYKTWLIGYSHTRPNCDSCLACPPIRYPDWEASL